MVFVFRNKSLEFWKWFRLFWRYAFFGNDLKFHFKNYLSNYNLQLEIADLFPKRSICKSSFCLFPKSSGFISKNKYFSPKECEGLETIHGFPGISIQVELVSTPVYGCGRYSRSTETRPEVRFLVFPVSSCCWSMFSRVARYVSYVNARKACDDTNDTWHGSGKRMLDVSHHAGCIMLRMLYKDE